MLIPVLVALLATVGSIISDRRPARLRSMSARCSARRSASMSDSGGVAGGGGLTVGGLGDPPNPIVYFLLLAPHVGVEHDDHIALAGSIGVGDTFFFVT